MTTGSNNRTRAMLDTFVWINLKDDTIFHDQFREIYNENDLHVVFSIGNFLDLVRRDNQDELAYIIDEYTDEYLAPIDVHTEGEYKSSQHPLLLATIDEEWYEYCKIATAGLSSVETLQALFRDSDFEGEPATAAMTQFIDQLRKMEELDVEGRMQIPDDTTDSIAVKKAGLFHEHGTQRPDGMISLDDAAVPFKKYVLGMSLIYISETYHEPELGDYRDASIWIQALVSSCDVLWTEEKWKYEHPVIKQVLARVDGEDPEIVINFDEFQQIFN